MTLGGVIFSIFNQKIYFFCSKVFSLEQQKFSDDQENGKRSNFATRGEEISESRKSCDFALLRNLDENPIFMKSKNFKRFFSTKKLL